MAQINPVRYRYTGNGTNKQFAVPFDYIEPTDVQVSVDGVPTSGTLSPGLVTLATAPANGAVVEVYRSTDATTPMHVFQHGSPLLPKPLDDNFRQVLHSVEEGVATSDDAMHLAAAAINTADTALLASGQASTDAVQALQVAQTASANASAAIQHSQDALSTAGTAASDAAAALVAAGSAVNSADAAVQTAGTAYSTAQGIDAKATQALSNSADAVQRVADMEDIVDDLQSGGVTSFKGRSGTVTPEDGDYAVAQISGLTAALASKLDTSSLEQTPGNSSTKVMSQKAVTEALDSVSGLTSQGSGSATSFNDFTTPGIYSAGRHGAPSNSPVNHAGSWTLMVLAGSSGDIIQLHWEGEGPNNYAGEMWRRRRINGSWTRWIAASQTPLLVHYDAFNPGRTSSGEAIQLAAGFGAHLFTKVTNLESQASYLSELPTGTNQDCTLLYEVKPYADPNITGYALGVEHTLTVLKDVPGGARAGLKFRRCTLDYSVDNKVSEWVLVNGPIPAHMEGVTMPAVTADTWYRNTSKFTQQVSVLGGPGTTRLDMRHSTSVSGVAVASVTLPAGGQDTIVTHVPPGYLWRVVGNVALTVVVTLPR